MTPERCAIQELLSPSKQSLPLVTGSFLINLYWYFVYYYFRNTALFAKGLIFLYKVTGPEAFPLWGFCLVPLPPLIGLLTFNVLRKAIRLNDVVATMLALISEVVTTLLFIPLSITIVGSYIALGVSFVGFCYFNSAIRSAEEAVRRGCIRDMRLLHRRYLSYMNYSIWIIITVIISTISVSLHHPSIAIMLRVGGPAWAFVQFQIIFILLFSTYIVVFLFFTVIYRIHKFLELLEEEGKFVGRL